ncbi:hypothetical protein U9M48_028852 [Paspalum notatum var. saurae]|uniref:Uncharacterized protein n=1 Tax=Paspalum notatum var. saurae TaxID=547442 RepID=A0AAQ3TWA5_PASNO
MGRHRLSASSLPEAAGGAIPDPFPPELLWPFGRLDALNQDELRESAYEIFFLACRSTPAGTRPSAAAVPVVGGRAGAATPTRPEAAKNMAVTSRLKRALGLRARKTRPMVGAAGKAGTGGGRPMTSAEIMRRQMGVTEQTDSRVRKTLARCLVGPQMSKNNKVESLVLPLELLRHLKASDFSDANEHRAWQLRQLKVLEAGLVSHPSVPLDRGNPAASTLRDALVQTTTRGALSAAVMALSWRSVDICRWADGYPLNVHLYLSLLRAVFDARDETAVLDEVDELLELMRKTWNILGLNKTIHDVCFTWILLEKYVITGQVEPDLLSAVLAMLEQVRCDAAETTQEASLLEPGHLRILVATLASVHSWAEDKLLDYHEAFAGGQAAAASSSMESVVSLAVLAAAMMLSQDVPASASAGSSSSAAGEQVERYIKSSVRRAFTRVCTEEYVIDMRLHVMMTTEVNIINRLVLIGYRQLHETAGKMADSMMVEVEEDPCETLMYVAAQSKDLARVEKEVYSRVLRRWHPCPTAVAAAALHGCFGALLKRYISRMMACSSLLSSESVRVLHAAAKLDKWLLQMAAEDEPPGPAAPLIIAPYDVDATISGLVKGWMDERLTMGAECVRRARDSESWNPRSKAEPYAQSAVDLMKLAKVTVDELLEIQVAPACREELLQRLLDGIDHLVRQYALLVASSCGPSKESYVPPLPPLTRCNQDSKLVQLWKMAAPPCQVGVVDSLSCGGGAGGVDIVTSSKPVAAAVRPATSRGTQRLYVRLNTLHYLLAVLHSIDSSRALSSALRRRGAPRAAVFDHARPALDAAVLHVSELSAYRLVFLDSAHVLHQALYQGGVAAARVQPALRVMKQNLAFLATNLSERAQPLAVLEAMKASVEAFLMVVLAGGSGRAFGRADYGAVVEDFASLKRLFCRFGVAEEAVEREAAQAEGVLALMALSTEKLIDDFLGHYAASTQQTQPMMALPPPTTTRRWSRSDANTILRVLCYRDDEAASRFLKKAFDLPKRRGGI